MLRISDTLKHVSQSISDLIRAAYRCYSNALEKVRMERGWRGVGVGGKAVTQLVNEMCRLTVNRCICCAIYKRTYVQISTNYIYDRDGNGNGNGAGNEVGQRGAQRLKGRSQWVSQREATFLSRWPLVHVIRKRNRVHEAARSLGLGSRLLLWLRLQLWLQVWGRFCKSNLCHSFFFSSFFFFCISFHFLQ